MWSVDETLVRPSWRKIERSVSVSSAAALIGTNPFQSQASAWMKRVHDCDPRLFDRLQRSYPHLRTKNAPDKRATLGLDTDAPMAPRCERSKYTACMVSRNTDTLTAGYGQLQLRGVPDGHVEEDGALRVAVVKKRKARLFNCIRLFEKVECCLYSYLVASCTSGCTIAGTVLIEIHGDEEKAYDVGCNATAAQKVLSFLERHVTVLDDLIATNDVDGIMLFFSGLKPMKLDEL